MLLWKRRYIVVREPGRLRPRDDEAYLVVDTRKAEVLERHPRFPEAGRRADHLENARPR